MACLEPSVAERKSATLLSDQRSRWHCLLVNDDRNPPVNTAYAYERTNFSAAGARGRFRIADA